MRVPPEIKKEQNALIGKMAIFCGAGVLMIPALLPFDTTISSSMTMLMGGSSTLVGSLTAAYSFSALAAIFAPMLLAKIGNAKKLTAIGLFILSAISVMSAVLVYSAFNKIGAWAFLGITFIYGMMYSGVVCTGSAVLVKQNIPDKTYQLFNPAQTALNFLFSAAAAWGMQFLLTSQTVGPQKTYLYVFIASAVLLAIVALVYRFSHLDGNHVANPSWGRGFRSYTDEIKLILAKRDGRVFVICTVLFIFLWSAKSMYISIGYERDYDAMSVMYQNATAVALIVKAALFFLLGLAAKRFGNRAVLIGVAAVCCILPVLAQLLPFSLYWIVIIGSNIPTMACVFLVSQMYKQSDGSNYGIRYVLFTLLPMPISLLMPPLGSLAEISPIAVYALQLAAGLCVGAILIADCIKNPYHVPHKKLRQVKRAARKSRVRK